MLSKENDLTSKKLFSSSIWNAFLRLNHSKLNTKTEIYINGYFWAIRKLQVMEMRQITFTDFTSAASTWPRTVSGDVHFKCLVDTSVKYEKKKKKKTCCSYIVTCLFTPSLPFWLSGVFTRQVISFLIEIKKCEMISYLVVSDMRSR